MRPAFLMFRRVNKLIKCRTCSLPSLSLRNGQECSITVTGSDGGSSAHEFLKFRHFCPPGLPPFPHGGELMKPDDVGSQLFRLPQYQVHKPSEHGVVSQKKF